MLGKVFINPRWFASAVAFALAAAILFSRETAVGMALGVSSTLLNFMGLWGVIWILKQDEFDKRKKVKAAGGVLLFLGSLPLSLWCIVVVKGFGNGAEGGYLSGLALVYCWAIGWAEAAKP